MHHESQRLVWYGAQDVRPETSMRVDPLPSEVRVRIRQVGICGSDIHYYQHGRVGAFVPTRPFVLGHEACGIIDAVGSAVTTHQIGERIAIDPSQPCRICRACTTGHYNRCPQMIYLGSARTSPPTDGVFQEYLTLPASCCHPLPDQIDDQQGALLEPLAVALHALNQAQQVAGAQVLITGGGAIGQLLVMAARAYGAAQITLIDPVATRGAFARSHGADAAYTPDDPRLAAIRTAVWQAGFDTVFEASGAAAALQQAIALVRPGGTIVQVGTLPAAVSLAANHIMANELRLVGSFRFAHVFPTAIALAASGRLPLAALVTHTLPLTAFHEAMQLAIARDTALKVQLQLCG